MWPGFICGEHHKVMAESFQAMAEGKKKRLTLSLAPRAGKSELTCVFFPAWFLGKYPDKKIIQVSHKAELAVGFGRKVRNLFSDPVFREVFPGVSLRQDSKAAGRWDTNKGGSYYATGVGAGLAGFGADVAIADDLHADTDAVQAMYDPEVFNRVYEWWTSVLRQRLQPGARMALIGTRWGERDIIGRLLDDQKNRNGDKWEVINFPAIREDGSSYWPEFWPIEELMATKAAITAEGGLYKWNAQYMQRPTDPTGSLIKPEWWNIWNRPAPKCEFLIQSWDTAGRTTQRSNYSVCTTWGVFYKEDSDRPQVIMLDCWRDKVEFPELKKKALDLYKHWAPDACIVERRSAGEALVAEMRRAGIFLTDYTPTRHDGDKVVRVNAITDIFASGVVHIMNRDWTSTVLDEAGAFPMGANDDIVDTICMALVRFRQGHFLRLESDEDDGKEFNPGLYEKADYY